MSNIGLQKQKKKNVQFSYTFVKLWRSLSLSPHIVSEHSFGKLDGECVCVCVYVCMYEWEKENGLLGLGLISFI